MERKRIENNAFWLTVVNCIRGKLLLVSHYFYSCSNVVLRIVHASCNYAACTLHYTLLVAIFVGSLSYKVVILIRSLLVTVNNVILAYLVHDIDNLLNEKLS